MSEIIDINTDHLVELFIYRGYSFCVNPCGYTNFINNGSLPKHKLVYVYLYDPSDQYKVIKEGFIIRTRWRKYKQLNIKLKYNGTTYYLKDFNSYTEYLTSMHYQKSAFLF